MKIYTKKDLDKLIINCNDGIELKKHIINLQQQLEEKDKVIDEAFELSKELRNQLKLYLDELEQKLERGDISFRDISDPQYHYEDIQEIVEILERGKNEK